jgi:hypothetical protein
MLNLVSTDGFLVAFGVATILSGCEFNTPSEIESRPTSLAQKIGTKKSKEMRRAEVEGAIQGVVNRRYTKIGIGTDY